MNESNDYYGKLKVYNGRLYKAITDAGFENPSQFANATGIDYSRINTFLNFRKSPMGKSGWLKAATDIATAVNMLRQF